MDSTRRYARVRAGGGEPLGGDCFAAGDRIATALAAETVGVAQKAMEMAVEYARERKQFGRPIGSYQAVSHRCAQMLLEVEGSRSGAYYAAWCADAEPDSLPAAASGAKAYASDAGWRVCGSSLQVHGGIGFTWEHDLHFFLKRAKTNAMLFGSAREHRERVASLALAKPETVAA
jgi:alkylation response protein AidB-like acyl-CoA dehydrogenase